jgi:hypothetical protein
MSNLQTTMTMGKLVENEGSLKAVAVLVLLLLLLLLKVF